MIPNDVMRAIESERTYQDEKWGATLSGGREGDGSRTVDEFVCYISGYVNDLVHVTSHFGDENKKLDIMRKVAGLCIACFEQHGVPCRLPAPRLSLWTRLRKLVARK